MATPVPVPTLDPNAINTFIAQTADVAAMRTASVPTLTATATRQNTSTPEPTFTAVGTIIFSTSTPIAREQYFRVKHDHQLTKYDYRSRTAHPDWPIDRWGLQTPEVVRMTVGLKSGLGTHRTSLDRNWEIFIDALNDNNKKKLAYLKADWTALFDGAGFPQLESLTMGGNIITVDEERDGWVRVHTLDYSNPGTLKDVNYTTRPDLIHKFVVVGWDRPTQTTYFVNPPPGEIYWPLVSSREVWMPLEFLEAFPQLPMTVTADKTIEIRSKPSMADTLTGYKIGEGKTARVVEYYPSGSDVWGRLADGGWIALLIHEKGTPQYPTSWEMVTMPPLPPSK